MNVQLNPKREALRANHAVQIARDTAKVKALADYHERVLKANQETQEMNFEQERMKQ